MIKFSIIGCGRIFNKHLKFFESSNQKKIKLVSVCDVDHKALDKIRTSLIFKKFLSIDKLIKETNPDVVIILTPSGYHYAVFKKISKFRKHVIIEKPVALKSKHVEEMLKISKRNKTHLFVVKQNRYNLPIIELKKAIDKKRFGKIILATTRVRWKRDQNYFNLDNWRGTKKIDGGILWNQASHHIDLLIWLAGSVKSVVAKSRDSLLKIETEDTAICLINFNNGALGIIEATTAVEPKDLEGSVSIIGEKGTVIIGGFAVNKIENWDFIQMSNSDKRIKTSYNTQPENVYGFGHQFMYKDIINKLLKKKSNALEGKKILESVRVIEAIYKSIKLKKEIFL